MHLCPIRDDSWGIYDYRALARIGEDIVFYGASGGLKVHFGCSRIRRSRRLDSGFDPSAREMAPRFSADPNIMSYLFFCRWAQVEVDPRIRSSGFYRDGSFYCAALRNTQFIDTHR